MNADTVHTIYKALPLDEQRRLYTLISKDLSSTQIINKPPKTKPKIITNIESRNYLLKNIFNIKLKES